MHTHACECIPHTQAHIYTRAHTCTQYICTHMNRHAHMLCTYTHITHVYLHNMYIHSYTHAHTLTYMHTHTPTHMHTHTMCTHTHAHLCTLTHMHTHSLTHNLLYSKVNHPVGTTYTSHVKVGKASLLSFFALQALCGRSGTFKWRWRTLVCLRRTKESNSVRHSLGILVCLFGLVWFSRDNTMLRSSPCLELTREVNSYGRSV